jgi:hypothetical protein
MSYEGKCPICGCALGGGNYWYDDPIKTPLGLAGENYKGVIEPTDEHIYQLQQNRTYIQNEFPGLIPEEEKIVFTNVFPEWYEWLHHVQPCKKHIYELRQSTELVLQYYKISKQDYLSNDIRGFPLTTSTQTEWTDPDLTK